MHLENSDKLTRHKRPLLALTGIRFIAAFYVVVFHALPWLQQHFALPQPVLTFLGNGYLAVSLFFILSGFILTYTYEGQIEGRLNRTHFWEARFARIYPVYLLSLILAYAFERGLSLPTRVAVLTMVQAWNPRAPALTGAWNYPAWSLSVEIFFYLCFPFLLLWMSRSSDRMLHWLIVVLGAACVLLHTPVRGLGILDRTSFLANNVPLPVLRIPEFLMGMAIGLKVLRTGRAAPRPHHLRLYAAVFACIVLLSSPLGPWVSLVAIPFGIVVHDLTEAASLLARALATRPMVLLGSASYTVYLLQFPVRSWTRAFFAHFFPRYSSLGTTLTPVILVFFSIAVFYVWEEPCRKFIRSFFVPKELAASKLNSASPANNLGS